MIVDGFFFTVLRAAPGGTTRAFGASSPRPPPLAFSLLLIRCPHPAASSIDSADFVFINSKKYTMFFSDSIPSLCKSGQ